MTERSDAELLTLGATASRLLDDPGYSSLIKAIDEALTQEIMTTTGVQAEKRLELFQRYDGFRLFVNYLVHFETLAAKIKDMAIEDELDALNEINEI